MTLTLGGADMALFTLDSATGTLTFNVAPDFEMPRNGAPAADNTNTYTLTISAMNSVSTVESGTITVTVTDVNEAPVLAAITPGTFTEYTAGTFDITATDEDSGDTLAFTLNAPNHGATSHPPAPSPGRRGKMTAAWREPSASRSPTTAAPRR